MKTIHADPYRRVIAGLRDRRRELGLTQAAAARRISVGRTWLTRVEMCEIRLDVLQLCRICRSYGLSAPSIVRQLEKDLSDEDGPFYVLNIGASDPNDPELLRRRGLALRETGGGNFRVLDHPGLVVKDGYWRWPERELQGNTIDLPVA